MLPANSAWRPAGDGDPARLREGARVALAVGDWLCAIAGVDFAVAMAGVGLLVADAHTPPPPCTGGRCALGSSDYFVEGFGLTLAAGVGWLLSTIATAAAYQVGADRREKVRALPRATANGLRWVF